MNVESLRSNTKDNKESQEMKIAKVPDLRCVDVYFYNVFNKVAITNVLIWVVAWTPYCIINGMGSFGYIHLVSPLVSQIPCFLGKQ